ncbi:MAG: RdgB/HAM1 family non-canonical purine NTP pyrophosphatase [Tatlockia sp.]|nr:RdgB/HAM1 family non-canonical purine NTP pyrophosphatase [Tatlockia sp.]
MTELILATSNAGKIKELRANLPFVKCIPQSELAIPDADEIGLSFVENAIIKARQAARLGGKPALADDSGLVVQALNGEPGIYSARFAGAHAKDFENINLLLTKLAGIPETERQAYFYCAIVVIRHANDPIPLIATGQWCGTILQKPVGGQGFGYDPIFYLQEQQCTAAQLPQDLKSKLSHRGQALAQLTEQLRNL